VSAIDGTKTLSGTVTGAWEITAGGLKLGVYVHPDQGEYWFVGNSGNTGNVYQRTIRVSSGIGTQLFRTSANIGDAAALPQSMVVSY